MRRRGLYHLFSFLDSKSEVIKMNQTITTRIKNKVDTSSNWTTNNPVLLKGEIGFESDTGKWKIGDGSTKWASLAYTATNNSPTLAWNTTSTIGKVNGVELKVKLPSHPNTNQTVKTGSVTFGSSDAVEFVGSGATTITGDATNKKITISSTNTTYSNATTSAAGLMSAADKTKLNGIAENANNYSHPRPSSGGAMNASENLYKFTTDGYGHISSVSAVTKSDITGLGIPAQDTTYSAATTSAAGLMSAADKTKLDGIATGANKYSHPAGNAASKSSGLYKFATDSTSHISSVAAVTKADITGLGIPAQDTTYSVATSSTAGLVKSTTTGTTADRNYNVEVNSDGTMKVNVPWVNSTYTFNGAVSTIKDSNLTASRALISNSSGKVAVSAVTSTELGYLDGVTSAIQTQIDGKAASGHTHDVNIATSTGTNELTLAHGTKYALTAGGQSFVFTMPSDSNTHHTAYNYVGAADAASNAATNNGSTYLKLYENGTKRSQFLIKGEGATSVTSDASGNITISSTNSVYDDAGVKSRLTTLEAKPGLDKTGTITSVKVNGTSIATSGAADITSIPWSIVTGHNDVVELTGYSDANAGRGIVIKGGNSGYGTGGTNIRHTSTSSTFNTLKLPTTDGTLATQEWVTGKGYTTNTGTVTSIKVGSTSYNPSSGVVSLPAYPSVPSSLKNPNAVTIQVGGATVSTYDGSAAKTFNIAASTTVGAFTISDGTTTKTVQLAGQFTDNNTTYTTATTSTLGLVKSTTTGTTSGRDYAVQVNSDGTMKVNVPWTDTNTNTTNTTGTTEKASTKLFLAGATSQASAPQTFSNAKVYIGTDNCLYSNGSKVATQAAVDSLAQTVDELPTFDYVDDEIATVTAIANGKTRTYVLSYTPTDSSCNGNSVFNSNSDTIDLSQSHKTQLVDGTILNMSTDLKLGDIILVKETNVPDRWVMSVNGSGTFTLAKMETSKVDLAPYSENTHTHSVPAPTITVTGVSYTPAGTVSSGFTGSAATISVSGTPAGTIKTGTGTANYTPAGSVTVTPNTTTVNSITAVGTLPTLTTETVDAISSATFTAGTTPVSSATFSGTAATSGANSGTGVSAVNASLANGVLTITAVTAAPNSHTHSVTAKGSITLTRGTAPSLSTTPTSFEAVESWSAGTLPTKGSNTTVVTGIKSASFTGTGTQLLFTGSSLTSTGSYTPGGTVSSTWTGTAATIKPTVTASGTTTGKAST